MGSSSSIAGHLKDVVVILALGVVYVTVLAAGTVALRASEWIGSAAETGKATLDRIRLRTRSAR
jgi:hypothetical protein